MEHHRGARAFLHCSSTAVYKPEGHRVFDEDGPLGRQPRRVALPAHLQHLQDRGGGDGALGGRALRAADHDRPPVGALRRQRRLARHPPAHDAVGQRRPGPRRRAQRLPPAARRRHRSPWCPACSPRPRSRPSRSTGAGASRSASRSGAPTWPGWPASRPASSRRSRPSTACRSTRTRMHELAGRTTVPWREGMRRMAKALHPDRVRVSRGTPALRAVRPRGAAGLGAAGRHAGRAQRRSTRRFSRLDNPPLVAGRAAAARRAPTSSATRATEAVAGRRACGVSPTAWRRSSACTCARRLARGAWRRALLAALEDAARALGLHVPPASTPGPSRCTRCASTARPGYVEVRALQRQPVRLLLGREAPRLTSRRRRRSRDRGRGPGRPALEGPDLDDLAASRATAPRSLVGGAGRPRCRRR